jgi:hypothetical protein
MTVDNGGAPCVDGDPLSLAICKPMIRSSAKEGDVVFGFAANSLSKDNRLIYIGVVSEKLPNGDYYENERHSKRSDCIYRKKQNGFELKEDAQYHSDEGEHMECDLGKPPEWNRANVLLFKDFRYFGKPVNPLLNSGFHRFLNLSGESGQIIA